MKKLLLLLATVAATFTANAQIENAKDAVKNMGLGWNLGNTLDANSGTGALPSEVSYWNCQTLDSETCWGQPKATAELIKMMKGAGFGAIRVPVTWYNHMDADGKVDAAWMKRVHEVVDYVINEGLYCIINVHHDTGADGGSFHSWIKADKDNYSTYKDKFENLWKQIAEEFKSYDGKLLFEAYNEMLDAKNNWNAPANSTSYEGLNGYAQSFVDAVRATGGNNESRNLIVNTYAAANPEAPVKSLTLPKDKAENHTIVEVHAYPNFFTWTTPATLRTIAQVKSDVDYIFKVLKDNVISKGVPAIIGEWGSYGVNNGAGETDYDLRKDMFFDFCKYFIEKAKANDVATFYWMGLTDGVYRNVPAFNQVDLAELMAKTYHGDTFQGQFPVMEKSSEMVCFEGNKTLTWGQSINIAGDLFKDFGPTVQLNITYTQQEVPATEEEKYRGMQFLYGEWSEKINVIVDGKTYEADFQPFEHYGTPEGTAHTTAFTFDENTYNTILKKGLLFQGFGIIVTKATLSNQGSSSLSNVLNDSLSTEYFNLAGQRVASPAKGFYIQGGKKVYLK